MSGGQHDTDPAGAAPADGAGHFSPAAMVPARPFATPERVRERLRAGSRAIAVTGAAGSGKTALLDALVALLEQDQLRVFRVDKDESGRVSLKRLLSRIIVAPDEGGEMAEEEAAAACEVLMFPTTGEAGTVVAVDDAHTIEETALRLLDIVSVSGGQQAHPVAIVLVGEPELSEIVRRVFPPGRGESGIETLPMPPPEEDEGTDTPLPAAPAEGSPALRSRLDRLAGLRDLEAMRLRHRGWGPGRWAAAFLLVLLGGAAIAGGLAWQGGWPGAGAPFSNGVAGAPVRSAPVPSGAADAAAAPAAKPVAPPVSKPPEPSEAAAPPSPETPRPDSAHIVLRAKKDVWVQVRDRQGQLLLNRVLHAGETWPVPPGRPPGQLVLSTGNAGSTELLLDGQPTAPLGKPGAVRRDLPLDPDAIRSGRLSPPAVTPGAAQGR